MRRTRGKTSKWLKTLTISIITIGLLVGITFLVKEFFPFNNGEKTSTPPAETNNGKNNDNENNTDNNDDPIKIEDTYTDIRIAATGDIMFHSPQLASAYDSQSKTYDFKSVFEDVKPIISAADLAIANFETTTGGPSRPYTGYPIFNSPDEVVDAIKYAGFDVLSTANNHSLDTRDDGLKRTVQTIRSKGLDSFGTFGENPQSRVLMKDVKGIKIALLAYTESTNGLGAQYSPDVLNGMLNIMDKDKIIADIREAKELEADLIITFMHWGNEYAENPNAKQIEYAQMMANEGADIILGSHPHVLQKSEQLEVEGNKTFVVYSMGNFVSNQRRETLNNDLTEDGIIINFDIRKNNTTKETTIQNVEYVPTWVYRNKEAGKSTYTYRILPVDRFLDDNEISDAFKQRMMRSREASISKMDESLVATN